MRKQPSRGAAGQQYAIVVGLIAVIAIASISFTGTSIKRLFSATANVVSGVENAATPAPVAPVSNALYTFSSHTFTPCSATGVSGPALNACQTAYASTGWAANTAFFDVSAGIQIWTVPETATYTIEAAGAEGGDSNDDANTNAGKGALMSARFNLVKGDKIKILVGQVGLNAYTACTSRSGGGGGGSFVATTANVPMHIAAGGNGDNWAGWNTNGPGGRSTNTGEYGGQTETQNTIYGRAGGGGGFTSDGYNNTTYPSSGGKSFINGGQGGTTSHCAAAYGGFGGGGAGYYEGGGGGGYSGGHVVDTNQYNSSYPSYGAGSYTAGDAPYTATADTRSGDGYVTITKL